MKKGVLLVGRKTLGGKNRVHSFISDELETNRNSLIEDKIDSQIFILDGIDKRLKETTLEKLIGDFIKLFPNAQIVASLDSLELLSKEDLSFVKDTLEICFYEKGSYLKADSDEVFVDGIPIRLYVLKNMVDSPQFFKDICESTLLKALTILSVSHGKDMTMEHLQALLSNTNGDGEKMITNAYQQNEGTEREQKKVLDATNWFMQDYLTGAKGSRTATRTYEHTESLRIIIDKLVK